MEQKKYVEGTIIEINHKQDIIMVLDGEGLQWTVGRPKCPHKEGDLINVKLQKQKDEWYPIYCYKEYENEVY